MSNDELKKLAQVVRDVVREETKPMSDHLAQLTVTINAKVVPTQELHTKYFKQILNKFKEHDQVSERDQDNIERLDKRFREPEEKLGIQPPPEFQVIK